MRKNFVKPSEPYHCRFHDIFRFQIFLLLKRYKVKIAGVFDQSIFILNWNDILEQNQRENWCLFIPVLRRATLPPHLVIPEKTQQHHQRRKTVKNEKMSNHVIAMKWHSMFTEKGRSKSWTWWWCTHSLPFLKDLWLVHSKSIASLTTR